MLTQVYITVINLYVYCFQKQIRSFHCLFFSNKSYAKTIIQNCKYPNTNVNNVQIHDSVLVKERESLYE